MRRLFDRKAGERVKRERGRKIVSYLGLVQERQGNIECRTPNSEYRSGVSIQVFGNQGRHTQWMSGKSPRSRFAVNVKLRGYLGVGHRSG